MNRCVRAAMAIGLQHWTLLLLLCPVFGQSSSSSSNSSACDTEEHGNHGEHKWWDESHQYTYLECNTLVGLAVITMIFEFIHHALVHKAGHGSHAPAHHGHHGLVDQESREVFHENNESLWVAVVDGFTGELTVLGFLAFTVWLVDRSGGFEKIAEDLAHLEHLPQDRTGYLHTVEDVHMQLFISMCMFISMASLGVVFINRRQAIWTESHQHLSSEKEEEADPVFKENREKLFLTLQNWKGQWALLDDKLMPLLREGLTMEGKDPNADIILVDTMSKDFPFHVYLGLQVHALMRLFLHIQGLMWVLLVVIYFVTAQIVHSLDGKHLDDTLAVVQGTACIGGLLLTFMCFTGKGEKAQVALQAKAEKTFGIDLDNRLHNFNPGLNVMVLLQFLGWGFCYFVVRVVARPYEWQHKPWHATIFLVMAIIGVPAGGFTISRVIPRMAMKIAVGDLTLQDYHVHWMMVLWGEVLHKRRHQGTTHHHKAHPSTHEVKAARGDVVEPAHVNVTAHPV